MQPEHPRPEQGHPEHREHRGAGGAWTQPNAPYGQPGRPGAAESTGEWQAWAERRADRSAQPPAAGDRRYVPGPRPEYVEAFDGPARPPAAKPDPEAASAPEPPTADGEADAGQRTERGSMGRTFTGVLAAAVTTVLAVVVTAHVVDGRSLRTGVEGRSDPERDSSAASRSQGRPTPSRTPAHGAPGSLHDQLMGRFPLSPNLALGGAFATVGGADRAPGKGQVIRYRVDVEKGLPLDGELFARLVQETLNDPRSWGHGGVRTFERVSSGPVDWVITLASPGTTNAWCAKSGLDTSADRVSCDSASTQRVMINAYRWARGAETYGDDMLGYRRMLINHEVGHRLGHGHLGCPRDGALAPVMMQQTKFLATNGATCKPNPWPFP